MAIQASHSLLKRCKLKDLASASFCRNLQGQTKTSSGIVFEKEWRIKFMDRCSLNGDAHIYDYLRDHVAKDICDRIEDFKSDIGKRLIFNLGSCSGLVTKNLNPEHVQALIQGDISHQSIRRSKKLNAMLPLNFPIQYLLCDEEKLPLKSNSVDLVVSCLNLHWVNDLVSCFNQVHDILKSNSAFIGTMFGGDTLHELRSSLQLAELERLSGFSSHVAPKTTGQDVARLLQGNKFELITVDITEVKIRYPSMFELMFDLQGMGENNSSVGGSKHMHRDVLKASAAIYQQLYGDDDPDKGVPATFQMINFIGWKNPTKATPLKSA